MKRTQPIRLPVTPPENVDLSTPSKWAAYLNVLNVYPERHNPKPKEPDWTKISSENRKTEFAEYSEALDRFTERTEEIKQDMNIYRENQSVITEEFARLLANEYLSDLNKEKTDLVFAHAWEQGHSAGYQEVETCYERLADFALKLLE